MSTCLHNRVFAFQGLLSGSESQGRLKPAKNHPEAQFNSQQLMIALGDLGAIPVEEEESDKSDESSDEEYHASSPKPYSGAGAHQARNSFHLLEFDSSPLTGGSNSSSSQIAASSTSSSLSSPSKSSFLGGVNPVIAAMSMTLPLSSIGSSNGGGGGKESSSSVRVSLPAHNRRSSVPVMPVMMKDGMQSSSSAASTSSSVPASARERGCYTQQSNEGGGGGTTATLSRALSAGLIRKPTSNNINTQGGGGGGGGASTTTGAGGASGMDEMTSAQYSLEIAVGTINELQSQLVHSNRTVEQLAAENVALTRDLKKAKRSMSRMEAKVLKAKQVQADITPGARKILQETIEENTKMLVDFMEMVNKGHSPFNTGASFRPGGHASATAHDYDETQQEHDEEHYEEGEGGGGGDHGELQAVLKQLMELKRGYEDLLLGKGGSHTYGGGDRGEKRDGEGEDGDGRRTRDLKEFEIALMQESERRMRETYSYHQKREEKLQEEVDGLKRQVKTLQKREPEEKMVVQEQLRRLQAEYSSLQKHALVVSMQNDSLREELVRSKARNSMMKTNLNEAQDLYRRSVGTQAKLLEATIVKQVDEIDYWKDMVSDRESMLRNQLELKTQYEKELRAKRKEVIELRKVLGLPANDPSKKRGEVNRKKAVNLRTRKYGDGQGEKAEASQQREENNEEEENKVDPAMAVTTAPRYHASPPSPPSPESY